jgi:hypothetical protein
VLSSIGLRTDFGKIELNPHPHRHWHPFSPAAPPLNRNPGQSGASTSLMPKTWTSLQITFLLVELLYTGSIYPCCCTRNTVLYAAGSAQNRLEAMMTRSEPMPSRLFSFSHFLIFPCTLTASHPVNLPLSESYTARDCRITWHLVFLLIVVLSLVHIRGLERTRSHLPFPRTTTVTK